METLEYVNGQLNSRGFKSCVADSASSALRIALGIIGSQSVGIGGSLTVEQTGLYEALRQNGNAVYWHWKDGAAAKLNAAAADFYVCSANAVTRDGIIVLTDGSGNRISALAFGPKNAILIVGRNKIVADAEAAFARIRSSECAGANARRLGLSTPCADLGKCDDCSSPQRICSVTALFERPSGGLKNTYIIIVDEDLGL